MSRKPSKDLVKLNTSYDSLYESVDKIRTEMLAKLPKKSEAVNGEKKAEAGSASNDVEMETEESEAKEASKEVVLE